MLRVRVCATSANLAVGFDILGLALGLYNELEFKKSDEFKLSGFLDNLDIEGNLSYKAYISVFNYLNIEVIPVAISLKCNIPAKRGLGSSASLIVGGAYAANAVLGYPLKDDTLFNLCAKLEGHPDNVAAAIFGGLTSAFLIADSYKAVSYMVSDRLSYAVLIPPYEVETAKARAILPSSVGYSDISYTMSRLVVLPKAFAIGDSELLTTLFDDRLHEPYRKNLIAGYDEIKKMCSKNDVAMAISGSGSSILLISNDSSKLDNISYKDYKLIKLSLGDGVEIIEED